MKETHGIVAPSRRQIAVYFLDLFGLQASLRRVATARDGIDSSISNQSPNPASQESPYRFPAQHKTSDNLRYWWLIPKHGKRRCFSRSGIVRHSKPQADTGHHLWDKDVKLPWHVASAGNENEQLFDLGIWVVKTTNFSIWESGKASEHL